MHSLVLSFGRFLVTSKIFILIYITLLLYFIQQNVVVLFVFVLFFLFVLILGWIFVFLSWITETDQAVFRLNPCIWCSHFEYNINHVFWGQRMRASLFHGIHACYMAWLFFVVVEKTCCELSQINLQAIKAITKTQSSQKDKVKAKSTKT